MAFQLGQCCTDQIVQTPSPGGNGASGTNEIIPFDNVDTVTIPWNAIRKTRFGDAAVIYVEILQEDGYYTNAGISAVPDVVPNTTQYVVNLGGLATGRVIIT